MRLHIHMKRIEMKIPEHAEDLPTHRIPSDWIFQSHHLDSRFVENHLGGIGAEVLREETSLLHFHAERFQKVMIYSHDLNGNIIVSSFSLPIQPRPPTMTDHVMGGAGRTLNPWNLFYLGQKCRGIPLYTSLHFKIDHIIFIVSEVLVLYKVNLFVYDEHRHDEDDRQRKLEADQSLAHPHFTDRAVQLSLQHGDRVEPRQVE